jgi:hypothetical protein
MKMEVDILSIDKKLRDVWKRNSEKVKKVEEEISMLREILVESQDKLSIHVKKDLINKINALTEEQVSLENIISNQHFYTMDFSELIEKYNSIENKNHTKKKVFMEKKTRQEVCNGEGKSLAYLNILKKYNIEHVEDLEKITKKNDSKQKNKKQQCENPSCDSQDFIANQEQSVEICQNCGYQKESSYKSMNYKDLSRVNLSNKYMYERRIHFKDCINQFQGKQNSVIDEQVYKDIIKQLELHSLLNDTSDCSTSQEIKIKRFERVTREHILMFLKETGHSKHYEDVVLIYHKITGKKVPDISHLEVKLMEDFDLVSATYDKLFKFAGKLERKSFINTQYVLFQLLRRHKYPCNTKDFNMLKTLDRKSFHDGIVKTIFEHIGLNFVPLF